MDNLSPTGLSPNPSPKHSQNTLSERKRDFTLLREIFRRRLRLFLVIAPTLFLLFVGYGLFYAPQTFATYTSMAIQQTLPASNAVSLLSGGNASGGARYLGVLKSRSFAEQVEAIVHTQQLLGTKTPEEAVENLIAATSVEDSPALAMLILRVETHGPARLARDPEGKREANKHLSAFIANAYIQVFRRYLRDNDTDRETVLYREAEKRLKAADAEYRVKVAQYIAAARGKKGKDALITLPATSEEGAMTPPDLGSSSSVPAGSTQGQSGGITPGETTAGGELQALFLRRGTLERLIKTAEVTQSETAARLNRTPGKLTDLPAEDPLLTQARSDVVDAQVRLDTLRQTFADTAPRVIASRNSLLAAQNRLIAQARTIQSRNTSDAIKLQALRAELETVASQIEDASRRFARGKELTTTLEILRTDMTIALEKLKTTTVEFARLSLQTVSGQSRMTVIDKALPPKVGKPGIAVVLIFSVLGTLAFAGVWLALEYTVALLKRELEV